MKIKRETTTTFISVLCTKGNLWTTWHTSNRWGHRTSMTGLPFKCKHIMRRPSQLHVPKVLRIAQLMLHCIALWDHQLDIGLMILFVSSVSALFLSCPPSGLLVSSFSRSINWLIIALIVPAISNLVPWGLGLRLERMLSFYQVYSFVFIHFIFLCV